MDSGVNSKRADAQTAKSTGPRPASRRPALTEELVVGALIGGKYAAQRVIGKGAMGLVLAARHTALDIDVAIKFIKPEMRDAPDVVSRFAREAKASALIKSEHIANIIDVGICDRLGPYIVMEYLSGHDLAQILHAKKRLGIAEVCDYAMQVCEGLALAHSLNIVHRDIKPSNLFVTRRGELEVVKILDFGISKVALTGRVFGDDLSVMETSHMMGTPLYMSPEQIRSTSDVDHRADIWSLGVVMRELLTGKKTFIAKGAMQICALVLDGDPPPLERDAPDAPPGLCAVVRRCLDKDVEQRYQDVAELARALLPFAPQRSAVHAMRASSVLGNPDADSALALDPRAIPGDAERANARLSRPAPPKPVLAKPKPELRSAGENEAPTSVYERGPESAPPPPPRLGVPPTPPPAAQLTSEPPLAAASTSVTPPRIHSHHAASKTAPPGTAATLHASQEPRDAPNAGQHGALEGRPPAAQSIFPGQLGAQPSLRPAAQIGAHSSHQSGAAQQSLPAVLVTTPPSSIPGRRAPSEPASLVLTSPARARIKPTAVRVRAAVGAVLVACAIYGFVIFAYQRTGDPDATATRALPSIADQAPVAAATTNLSQRSPEQQHPVAADAPADAPGQDSEPALRATHPEPDEPPRGRKRGNSSRAPNPARDAVTGRNPAVAQPSPLSPRPGADEAARDPKVGTRARLVDEPNRVELLQ